MSTSTSNSLTLFVGTNDKPLFKTLMWSSVSVLLERLIIFISSSGISLFWPPIWASGDNCLFGLLFPLRIRFFFGARGVRDVYPDLDTPGRLCCALSPVQGSRIGFDIGMDKLKVKILRSLTLYARKGMLPIFLCPLEPRVLTKYCID